MNKIIFLLMCFFSVNTFAAMQCGNAWINVGATEKQVITQCGKPSTYKNWTDKTLVKDPYRPNIFHEYKTYYSQWVYNRGSNLFIMYLTFKNNILVAIDNGEYGN